ncbi:MAG: hypothetical protein IIA61_08725 [Candidatus Marinimicrobia bacterium]|nr:hypothetical protein [Candidatus Neomarinimicrobiota bacterium]
MSIDFQDANNRKAYLTEKLDDLLDGINATYGTALMDELISRLEQTVSEFNKEVQSLMNTLKENSEKKGELLEKIKAGEFDTLEEKVEETKAKQEMSEWERRLESMGKS